MRDLTVLASGVWWLFCLPVYGGCFGFRCVGGYFDFRCLGGCFGFRCMVAVWLPVYRWLFWLQMYVGCFGFGCMEAVLASGV